MYLHSDEFHTHDNDMSLLPAPPLPSPSDLAAVRGHGQKNGKRRLWELPEEILCPVIGTCLDTDAMRSIAKKVLGTELRDTSDYELHTTLIGAAKSKTSLALATQKFLDRKYQTNIRRFAGTKDERALMALWDEQVSAGAVAGALWALVTHPETGSDALSTAYQRIHMLSHQTSSAQQRELEKLAGLRAELDRLREQADGTRRMLERRLREKQQAVDRLRPVAERAKCLQDELLRARQRVRELESDTALQALEDQLQAQIDCNRILRRENEHHQNQLARQRPLLEKMELAGNRAPAARNPRYRESSACQREGCAENAPDDRQADAQALAQTPDLFGLRVLCVGGRHNLVDHYRGLVMRFNGEFIHHDGGKEQRRGRLDALIESADAVICPLDCVSHDAVYRCKRDCKKLGKPCMLLDSSGITAFARGLERIVERTRNDAARAVPALT